MFHLSGANIFLGKESLGMQQRVLLCFEDSSSSNSYSTGWRLLMACYSAQSSGEIFFLKMEESIPLKLARLQNIIQIQPCSVQHLFLAISPIVSLTQKGRQLLPVGGFEKWLAYIDLQFCRMEEKCVEMVSRKLKPGEMLLDMVPIMYFTSSDNKYSDWLAISSETFYFVYNNHLKKQISIADIKMVTVSAFSHQIVLHCDQEDLRISSYQNAKIFKNILNVREKVLNNKELLTVLIEKEKNLSKYAGEEEKKRSFFSTLFHRSSKKGKEPSSPSSSAGSRHSFCKLEVSDKTFLHQVSQKIYTCNYSNVQLLYISGGYGFFFDQFDFHKVEVDSKTYLFRPRQNKESFILRKILKENEETNTTIREYLENFKLNSNKEEILYAIESSKHFEIISPYSKEQKDLEELLEGEQSLSQIDLVSIFYKMMGLIDCSQYIFHSLKPKHIIVKDSIVVSEVMCINRADVNINYLAPEELDSDLTLRVDPSLINLWKVGVLLYEAAFLVSPFPIEHLAQIIIHNKPFRLSYPPSNRSLQFRNFLGEILQVDSSRRGGGPSWKKTIFDHKWLRQSMR